VESQRHIVSLHRFVDALRAAPRGRPVELAHTESGRHSMRPWFEDQQALLHWYRSEFLRGLQSTSFSDYTPGEPLVDVAMPDGPLVAAASFALDQDMDTAAARLRIDGITAQLHTPLSAGSLLGGDLGPDQAQEE